MKNPVSSLRSIVSTVLLAVIAFPFAVLADGDGNKFADPNRFADWTTFGPEGGDVRSVAIDPKDKDHIFISTADGQIHSSVDGGKNWRLLVNLNQPQLVL